MVYRNKKELIENQIESSDVVLDVGFWGHGLNPDHENWVHNILLSRASEVWGIDLDYDLSRLKQSAAFYKKSSAESFSIDTDFNVIFAGDLIEHLSNPGLFLGCAFRHLKTNGKLIITTPNAFNLFNIAEKMSKFEPTVNSDHTAYFNSKTLRRLLEKNNFVVKEISYIYTLELSHKESWKKKILNLIYYFLSLFTSKYIETLVVIAEKK